MEAVKKKNHVTPLRKEKTETAIKTLLHSLFYDVTQPSAYTGKENVFRAAKRALSSITRADVDRWFEDQRPYTVHKPVRLRFKRNKTIVKSIDDQWQTDLCDMQSKSSHNDGNAYILTCIDCFSKYAWAEPLQQKTADNIIKAMSRIFASGRKPKRLQTDKGSEFTNAKVQAFLRKNKVDFFTTDSEKKASIVERFNRTLKNRMFKYFSKVNSYRYVDVLQALVDGYNGTYHRSIKMQPKKVRHIHQPLIRQRLYGEKTAKRQRKNYKYNIGDWVRISKQRVTFAKGYLPGWSEEIFVIRKRRLQREPIYYLRDLKNENVTGAFYEPELQRVHEPTEYHVEKVLRSRTRRDGVKEYFVKWKGYDASFNSWVKDIRDL